MKNPLSTAILAAALALLLPTNGAEAEGGYPLEPMPASVQVGSAFMEATAPYFGSVEQAEPDPTIAWLMVVGFLGLIVARRIRGR